MRTILTNRPGIVSLPISYIKRHVTTHRREIRSGRRITGTRCVQRDQFLIERCTHRSVLHVGCTCSPNLLRNLHQGTLLHPRLERVAKQCVGIDINAADIKAMQALGHDVREMDATDLSKLRGSDFDVVVLADIIEHVTHPGAVIQEAMNVAAPAGEIIVTVPNAFGLIRFMKLLFRHEQVHPDHVAYYSSGTLTALAERYALRVTENVWYRQENRDNRVSTLFATTVERFAVSIMPWVGEGCIAVMKKR